LLLAICFYFLLTAWCRHTAWRQLRCWNWKCWICMLVDWIFESAVLFESVRRRPISCAVSCQLHSLPPHWTVAARSPQTAPALEHWVRIVFLGRRRLKKHCLWNVKCAPVDSESWLPFIWEHAASIGIFDRVQPVPIAEIEQGVIGAWFGWSSSGTRFRYSHFLGFLDWHRIRSDRACRSWPPYFGRPSTGRRRMNKWMKSLSNFERLVFGCIDASDRKNWRTFRHLSWSTRLTDFCIAPTSKFEQKTIVRHVSERSDDPTWSWSWS